MTLHTPYSPGPAGGARIEKDGEKWTLVIVRDLPHRPALVWQALTEPEHLAAWAPFDANRSLATVGPAKLTMAGMPAPLVFDTAVVRAEAPRLLEYAWGAANLRWELEPRGSGTRMTLWHNIDRRFITWGAAGWHICFDVMERHLDGTPIGRMVGPATKDFPGWRRLTDEYARLFGVEAGPQP